LRWQGALDTSRLSASFSVDLRADVLSQLSYISEGSEACSCCLAVTMVFPEDRLMAKMFNEEMATYYEKYYEDKGVTLIKGDTVTGFEGDGKVEGIHWQIIHSGKSYCVVAVIGILHCHACCTLC